MGGTVHSLLDYHKPPATVNNQKPFRGAAASGNIALNKQNGRDALPADRLRKHGQPHELGRGVIFTVAPAHVYMAVVCCVWADGWWYGPSLVPRLDRSSWQIALQSSFSCSSPWGAVIDDSHCHLDPFSPPIWLLTGRLESSPPSLVLCTLPPSPSSSPFKFKWAHFLVYQQRGFKTSTLYKLKTELYRGNNLS